MAAPSRQILTSSICSFGAQQARWMRAPSRNMVSVSLSSTSLQTPCRASLRLVLTAGQADWLVLDNAAWQLLYQTIQHARGMSAHAGSECAPQTE